MKTLCAFVFALTLASGAAFAQGSGGGGTEAGPKGGNTGKEQSAQTPTPEQCTKGWDSSMRITQAEFNDKCKK